MLMGPNGGNFWSNLTTLIQIQANYNCQLVKHLKQKNRDGPYAMYVDEDVQTDYNKFIRDRKTMGPIAVLAPGCKNFYTVIIYENAPDTIVADSCERTRKAKQPFGILYMGMFTDGDCEDQTTKIMLSLANHQQQTRKPHLRPHPLLQANFPR